MKALHMFAGLLLLAGAGLAQNLPSPHEVREGRVFVQTTEGGPGMVHFIGAEMFGSIEPVKDAPYSATAVTESTQVLSDGNRIVNRSSGLVARDSDGRVRREESMGRIGPLQLMGPKLIFIGDPVSKTHYVLNPDTQVARVMKPEGPRTAGELRRALAARKTELAVRERVKAPGEIKQETLPDQVIEGVNCQGVRVTHTLPAGAIGNERPIETITEIWTSPELHVVVMKKNSDPRLGESVYRLTDIKRGEPDASLFQVPSGYKTEIGPPQAVPPPPPDK